MSSDNTIDPVTDFSAGGGHAVGIPVMIDAGHEAVLRQRHLERVLSARVPGRRGPNAKNDGDTGTDQKTGPEAVAKFPNAPQTGGYGYGVDPQGIATVAIRGVITPEQYAWYDNEETISDFVVRDLAAMAADPAVKGVVLAIDSPGGYVAGSFEMADAISRFAAVKPIATFASGYCCSAAYLQAVQTPHITAYRTAIVGSIGTRSAVIDARELFAKFGVKMIPIDSGGMKSAGLIGTEITPEQIEYFRGTVKALQTQFTAAVAAGRKVSAEQATKWADGRVHVAGDGLTIGLIDAVGSAAGAYQQVLQAAQAAATKKPRGARAGQTEQTQQTESGGDSAGNATAAGDPPPSSAGFDPGSQGDLSAMANANAQSQAGGDEKPATMAELKATLVGASSDFLVEQSEKLVTLAQAKDNFIGWQAAQVRDRDAQIAALKAERDELATKLATASAANAAAAAGTATAGTAGASGNANAPARPGIPPASSTPAEGVTDPASFADPKERAKAEWAANTGNCRNDFSSERAYVGYRSAELAGKVSRAKVA